MKPSTRSLAVLTRNALGVATFSLAGVGVAIIGNLIIWGAVEGIALAERAAFIYGCAAFVGLSLGRGIKREGLLVTVPISAILVFVTMWLGRLIIGPDYIFGPDPQVRSLAHGRPSGSNILPSATILLGGALISVLLRLPERLRGIGQGSVGNLLSSSQPFWHPRLWRRASVSRRARW